MISKWLPKGQKISKLLYRGSVDGSDAAKFHEKCDCKPTTLVIVESVNGKRFGGYSDQTWNGISEWKSSSNCFLFSIDGKEKLA